MMKSLAVSLLLLLSNPAEAFVTPGRETILRVSTTTTTLSATTNENTVDRRSLFQKAAASCAAIGLASLTTAPAPAFAATVQIKKVAVAGATGQTGRRILERLASSKGLSVIGGVRNVDTASASLSKSSTVIRGAMVQSVSSVDTSAVDLRRLNVVDDSVDTMAETLKGVDGLVIAVGYVPGNPLKWNEAAHSVDNVGTCRLIDAAKKAGVKKVVLVTSILTNGRAWGQEKSAGFVITNAFGSVLDEKLIAENYLRASGMDYTIVRPGGLKAKPATGALLVKGEDTTNSGEISRDLVADVCVASLTDPKTSKKILEIIEDDGTPPKAFNGLVM